VICDLVRLKEVKMPRLSEKTLEKRFQCQYCGETFRTRQGLSGHIRFKHQNYYEPYKETKQPANVMEKGFILSKRKDFAYWRKTNGLRESTNESVANLFINWMWVVNLFQNLDIELTEKDFKTYLLAGLSKVLS
jgi:hypothetical protein